MKRCLALLFVGLLTCLSPASAQDSMQIAAVVNDDIITMIDLLVRTRVALVASQQPDTPENRSKLLVPALRNLIDERLKQQAARAGGVEVADEEVNDRMQQLASQNSMSVDEFKQGLLSRGILVDNFTEQMRAELGWVKVVQQRFRNSAAVTDKDVDDEIQESQKHIGTPEYLVAEIFLPVYSAADAEVVRRNAEELMQQLRSGADFSALARQFSQSATAGNGGQLGWTRRDQLDPAVANAVGQLQSGQVTGPVQVAGGYTLLALRDQRSTTEALDRAAVRDQLLRQRLDRLARGYLTDLRNAAFIDIRIDSGQSAP